MNKTFYMVFVDGGDSPKYVHHDFILAEAEAKRLAKMLSKKTFVLASIKSYELNEFKVEDLRPGDDLPF